MILLQDTSGRPLTKAWRATASGATENKKVTERALKQRYLRVVETEELPRGLAGLTRLHAHLTRYQERRDTCLVRGALRQSGPQVGGVAYRASEANGGDVVDAPGHLIVLDLDSVEAPTDLPLRQQIDYVINTQLSEIFRNISYLAQFSASSGFKPALRCKLAFMADRAVTNAELKELHSHLLLVDEERLRAAGKSTREMLAIVDRAIFSKSQMIFIGCPHLSGGLSDPHPPNERTFLVQRERDEVPLPRPPAPRVVTEVTRHNEIGVTGDIDRGAETLLERAVGELRSQTDGRYIDTFLKARLLGRLFCAGRLERGVIEERLMSAAEANGSVAKRGRARIEAQIRQGITSALSATPLYSRAYSPPPVAPIAPVTPVTPVAPSTAEEVNAEVERVMRKAIRRPTEMITHVSLPVGAGKTSAALREAVEYLAQTPGATVIFAVANYALMAEAEAYVRALPASPETTRLEGRMRQCQLHESQHELRADLTSALDEGVGIPAVCAALACPFFSGCALRKSGGVVERSALGGRFTLTTHAMLPHLKEIPADALILIDETPELTYSTRAELPELAALSPTEAERQRAPQTLDEHWRATHPHTAAFAAALVPLLSTLVEEKGGASTPYAEDIAPAALAEVLRRHPTLPQLAAAALEEDAAPPVIPREQLRERLAAARTPATHIVRARALNLLKKTATLVRECALSIALVFDRETIQLEHTTALRLPPVGKLVLLDATANAERWSYLAAPANRTFEQLHADPTRLRPHPVDCTWIKTSAFSRNHLLNSRGDLTDRGVGAMRTLATLLSDHHLLKGRVGIGTHKPLALELERAQQNQGPLASHPLAAPETLVGFTGRHHRGTNAFAAGGITTLLILGDPALPPRDARRALETLKILSSSSLESVSSTEARADYAQEVTATQTQWLGRARSLRRPGLSIIYAGAMAPPPCATKWKQILAPIGRPRTEERMYAQDLMVKALARGERVTQARIEDLGVTRQQTRDIWAHLLTIEGVAVTTEGRSSVLQLVPKPEPEPEPALSTLLAMTEEVIAWEDIGRAASAPPVKRARLFQELLVVLRGDWGEYEDAGP